MKFYNSKSMLFFVSTLLSYQSFANQIGPATTEVQPWIVECFFKEEEKATHAKMQEFLKDGVTSGACMVSSEFLHKNREYNPNAQNEVYMWQQRVLLTVTSPRPETDCLPTIKKFFLKEMPQFSLGGYCQFVPDTLTPPPVPQPAVSGSSRGR